LTSQKKKNQNSYTIFISHSSKDSWIAKQIASLIEQKGRKYGINTFLDENDIEGGDFIPELIRENIKDCYEFVVLLSKNSIKRPWVWTEIGGAWLVEKRIIAILHEINPNELPDVISLYKAIDLNKFDDYLEELLKRVKEYENADKAKRKN
jgi:hypothetical protein